MSETQQAETINTPAAIADVAHDAARPQIPAPEHRDTHADQINIHVNNTLATPASEVVTTPLNLEPVQSTVVSNEGLETHKTGPIAVKKEAASQKMAPIAVTQEEFEKAEKNLAKYIGACFQEQNISELTDNLVISLGNRYEVVGTNPASSNDMAMNSIGFDFRGSKIAANHVLMNGHILGMLYAHPIIGPLVADSHPGMDEYRPIEERVKAHDAVLMSSSQPAEKDQLKFFLGNLSDIDYALMIKMLASHENLKSIPLEPNKKGVFQETVNPKIAAMAAKDAAAQAILATHADAQLTTPVPEVTPVVAMQEPSKPAAKEEADIAASIVPPESKTIPLTPAPKQDEQAAVTESTTIPLGIAAEADTRVALPAEPQGKIGEKTLEQIREQQGQVRA